MNPELERLWPDDDRREGALFELLRTMRGGRLPTWRARPRRPDLEERRWLTVLALDRIRRDREE